VCVCVCVCVRERERERVLAAANPKKLLLYMCKDIYIITDPAFYLHQDDERTHTHTNWQSYKTEAPAT